MENGETSNVGIPSQDGKYLNGLSWFFFDKVRHFFNKMFVLSDASRYDFEKSCSTSFAK
jgi:hypothetical protein